MGKVRLSADEDRGGIGIVIIVGSFGVGTGVDFGSVDVKPLVRSGEVGSG